MRVTYPLFLADSLQFSRLKEGGIPLLDAHWWQLLLALLLVFSFFLVRKVTLWCLHFFLRRWLLLWKTLHATVSKKMLNGFARPFSTLLTLSLLLPFIPLLRLPAYWTQILTSASYFLLALFFTISSYRFVDGFVFYLVARFQRGDTRKMNHHFARFGRTALHVLVLFFGASLMLNSMGVSLVHLLAGLSVGGLAIALAAQDTFKNLFGSIMILIDRPFKEGDWIVSDHIDGVVENIGLRATRIRTFEDSLLYISNARLSEAPLNNYGLRKYRRYYTRLPVAYHTRVALLRTFVEGLCELVKRHPHTRKDNYEIHVHEYTDTHIYVMFYIFFDVPTWSEELVCRHDINLNIRALADFLGVEMGVDFLLLSPSQAAWPQNMKTLAVKKSSSSRPRQKKLSDFFDKKK